MTEGKAIILSAPSGSGKTTILKKILPNFPELEFSISATSRSPREGEENGKDYYFLSAEEFRKQVADEKFLEWEEVYDDCYYGTLYEEVERIWKKGNVVIFDVDVLGGLNIKKSLGQNALSLFIMPPDITVLEQRLRGRSTETEEVLRKRINRAEMELGYAQHFDHEILNDDIEVAVEETTKAIQNFIKSKS